MSKYATDTDFEELFNYPSKVIKIKMKNKLRLLKSMKEVSSFVPVAHEMCEFLKELITWLENSIIWALNPFEAKPGLNSTSKIKAYFRQAALTNEFKILGNVDH